MPIREHDRYSFRNTIRAGCIRECWLFFQEIEKRPSAEKARRNLADGVILGNYAYSTRMALWKIFALAISISPIPGCKLS